MTVIEYQQPPEFNDDLSELYKIMTEDPEIQVYIPEYKKPADTPENDVQSAEWVFYSTYELTAYIATGNPCADGVYPVVGYTAASNDPNLWHKWVYIEGLGRRYIHDTGGMPSNVIDIFTDTYDNAIMFGRQVANIYIIEEE